MRIAKTAGPLLVFAFASFGATTFSVSIDTSSLNGAGDFMDLNFNGGFPATATIDNFTGAALNGGSLQTFGTITGTLPAEVVMSDDGADYFEGLTFGNTISFLVTFDGTPGGATGNTFAISFLSGSNDPLLTGNLVDGFIARFDMDTSGNVTPTTFANPSGGPSFAGVQLITPEPGTGLLLMAGVALFAAGRRNRV